MPNRKKNNMIIVIIIVLFGVVAISGLFIIDAIINKDINNRKESTTAEIITEEQTTTYKKLNNDNIKEEINKQTTVKIQNDYPEESTEQTTEKPEPTEIETTYMGAFNDITPTTVPPVTQNTLNQIGNELLQEVIPVNMTLTKKMGEDDYYLNLNIQNNSSYVITGITLSYLMFDEDYTYILYQDELVPGQVSEELTCMAYSGTEPYPLYSEEISFIDDEGIERYLTYNAMTKEMSCF